MSERDDDESKLDELYGPRLEPEHLLHPRMRLSTVVPREITECRGIPVVPPVRLGVGGSVEVWMVIERCRVRYAHHGSSLHGARGQLLGTLLDRVLRLTARDACEATVTADD